jgi:tetratricopeptide (TPR) repeat protein
MEKESRRNMIYEGIIVAAILIIFIILARKAPQTRSINFGLLNSTKNATKDNFENKNNNVKTESKNVIKDKNLLQADELFNNGKLDQAEEKYIILIAKDPNNEAVYNKLGIIYLEQKNYNDAIDAFNESIKHGGKKPGRFYNLALAHYGNEEYRKAYDAVNSALELDDSNEKYKTLFKEINSKVSILKNSVKNLKKK